MCVITVERCWCPNHDVRLLIVFKQIVHGATFVVHDKTTSLFVHAALELLHVTFYTSFPNKQAVYYQVTCRM